jgi:hypothetical protein
MLSLINKYGGEKFYKKLITQFYEEVTGQRAMRHYFFNVPFEKLLSDQLEYGQFIMKKTDRGYREPPMQWAPNDIRVSPSVFDEVMVALENLMYKAKVARDDIPIFNWCILDLCEETRSQTVDTKIMTLKAVEINSDSIKEMYDKNKADGRVEKNGEVFVTRGVTYPIWNTIKAVDKTISLIGRAFTNDPSRVKEMNEIKEKAMLKVPFLNLQSYESEKVSLIHCELKLSFAQGIPVRLMLKCAREFSTAFNEVLAVDKEQVLKNLSR